MKIRIIQALILTTFLVLFLFDTKDMDKNQEANKVTTDKCLTCEELCLYAGIGYLIN